MELRQCRVPATIQDERRTLPMDLSQEYQETAERAEKKAKQFLAAGDRKAAEAELMRASHLWKSLSDLARTPALQSQRLGRSLALGREAESVRSGRAPQQSHALTQGGSSRGSQESEQEDEQFTARIRNLVTKSNVTWDQIAGIESVKGQIKSMFAIALAIKPKGVKFETKGNVLLYGPPGTGKTMLAKAVSTQLAATFYSIATGDLLSKWFGDSPRLVKSLYVEATRTAPTVVFFDEFEVLTPDRNQGGDGAERSVLSAILQQLDGLKTKASEELVITLAATNKPWLMDSAALSRFSRKVYLPLPDLPARREIFRLNTEAINIHSDVPLDDLAAASDGLSGREICGATTEAIQMMIARANPGLVDLTLEVVIRTELKLVPISKEEFDSALSNVVPAASPKDIAEFKDWRRRV